MGISLSPSWLNHLFLGHWISHCFLQGHRILQFSIRCISLHTCFGNWHTRYYPEIPDNGQIRPYRWSATCLLCVSCLDLPELLVAVLDPSFPYILLHSAFALAGGVKYAPFPRTKHRLHALFWKANISCKPARNEDINNKVSLNGLGWKEPLNHLVWCTW